ncbi:hypothetical protein EVAR_37910_1 [Eumeta japonica]|uniref:Uncharacterized protein n=1 Tax=Eumeta variegata TaxID=151549 RepID=A0A4C1XE49_EUMVA|nr:hypothetical protein EVAR_37910_1 [Eumeta japonica]
MRYLIPFPQFRRYLYRMSAALCRNARVVISDGRRRGRAHKTFIRQSAARTARRSPALRRDESAARHPLALNTHKSQAMRRRAGEWRGRQCAARPARRRPLAVSAPSAGPRPATVDAKGSRVQSLSASGVTLNAERAHLKFPAAEGGAALGPRAERSHISPPFGR